MGSGDHAGGVRGFASRPPKQSDGGRTLPHIITGLISIALTLVAGHFTHVLQGQQGPKGTSVVITKAVTPVDGLCAYFGPDSTGRIRLQLATPKEDAAGPWCAKGTYISTVPVKKK